jgi:hypothetical protein
MTDGGIRENVDVFVDGQTIMAIEDTGSFSVAKDTKVVDGKGLFMIPGLADMHVHVRHESMLPLFAAYGVTMIRDMWGTPERLALRQRVLADNLFAPSIIVGSPGVDGNPPTFPNGPSANSRDEAIEQVSELLEAGYDFIKIYDRLSPEALEGVAQACTVKGVAFVGHPPFGVSLAKVLESGIASIEHLQGYTFAATRDYVGISTDSVDPAVDFPKLMGAAMRSQQDGGGIAGVFDPAKREHLAKQTAAHGVWNTPTLIALLKTNTPSDEWDTEFSRKEVAYVHPDLIDNWQPENNFRFQFLSDNQLRGLRMLRSESIRMTRELQSAGAGLLLGTDTPEAFIIPGISVHEELEEFVGAGLTPMEALATTTSNVGRFLGQPETLGSIREGARADLVLLRGNPLVDIRNTREIQGVVMRGVWHDKSELEETLRGFSKDSEE